MKVLAIDSLFFKLPEDFEGGLSDALRSLADYHEQPATAERQRREKAPDDALSWREFRTKLWKMFLEAVSEGNRMCGTISLSETQDSATINLDVNTGAPKK